VDLKFKVGDLVEWNSPEGIIRGTVKKIVTTTTSVKGHIAHASEEEPQYVVESTKTGHTAIHKGSALTKLK
jgi:small-conductance mechanosensitive channel